MSNENSQLLQQYRNYTSTIVSDALDEHGIDGVITSLRPAHPDYFAVGRARTVELESSPDDVERSNFPYSLFQEFARDNVFVINGVSPEVSCWGGLASRLAHNAGMGGTIINGGYRDHHEIRAGEYPVFGANRTPRSGQPRVRVESIGEPITINGITIENGDLIVADSTGVTVVPAAEAEPIAETADEILGKELVLDKKVESGTAIEALMQDYDGF